MNGYATGMSMLPIMYAAGGVGGGITNNAFSLPTASFGAYGCPGGGSGGTDCGGGGG